jgi:hypothetical protein
MELNEETGKYYHAADSAEYSIWTYYPGLTDTEELYVVLYEMGIPVAEVNLATLFALASV